MLQSSEPADYVISTGLSYSVRDFLELCFGLVSLNWQDYVSFDEKLFRPTEVDHLKGDSEKARRELGWTHSTDLSELAQIMVNYERRYLEPGNGTFLDHPEWRF